MGNIKKIAIHNIVYTLEGYPSDINEIRSNASDGAEALKQINGIPTFGGLQISSGPLAYENGQYVIKEGWNHSSYNVAYGKTEGSTYFNFLEMGELFEKSGFSANDGDIENLLDPFNGWRIPTSAEWCTLTTGKEPGTLREGSIVNGVGGKKYALVQMKSEEVTYVTNTSPIGLLLFPDGCDLTIKVNGSNIVSTNTGTINTNMTLTELNNALSQGCAFIPCPGYAWQGGSWNDWGKGIIRSSSSYDASSSKSLYFVNNAVYPMGRSSSKQAEYVTTILVKSVSSGITKRLSDLETEISNKVDKPTSPTNGHLVKVNASGDLLDTGLAMVKMNKAEYDALVTKDPLTMYLVSDGTPNGVYIYYTDNSMSPYDELIEGKTPLGVAVLTDSVKILLNPDCDYNSAWSEDTSTIIDDVVTVEDYDSAIADLNGESNTAAVIASGLQSSAFDFATSKGQGWYLPSFGELQQLKLNVENINVALGLVSGEPIYFSANYLWSSTQYNGEYAWCHQYDEPRSNNFLDKTYIAAARAVKALQIAGPSFKIYFGSVLIADSSLPSDIESLLSTI